MPPSFRQGVTLLKLPRYQRLDLRLAASEGARSVTVADHVLVLEIDRERRTFDAVSGGVCLFHLAFSVGFAPPQRR